MYSTISFMVSFLSSPIYAGLSRPAAAIQESGNPWWIWILIFLAFSAFFIIFMWWFMRSQDEEEEEITALDDQDETIALSESETETIVSTESEVLEAEDVVETDIESTPEAATSAEETVPEPPAPAPPQTPDNLKRVEGIGPKIASVLQAAGITTFAQLAGTEPDQIRQILEDENPNLVNLADPTSWPAQAHLAASEKWDELKQLQDKLRGGRHS